MPVGDDDAPTTSHLAAHRRTATAHTPNTKRKQFVEVGYILGPGLVGCSVSAQHTFRCDERFLVIACQNVGHIAEQKIVCVFAFGSRMTPQVIWHFIWEQTLSLSPHILFHILQCASSCHSVVGFFHHRPSPHTPTHTRGHTATQFRWWEFRLICWMAAIQWVAWAIVKWPANDWFRFVIMMMSFASHTVCAWGGNIWLPLEIELCSYWWSQF